MAASLRRQSVADLLHPEGQDNAHNTKNYCPNTNHIGQNRIGEEERPAREKNKQADDGGNNTAKEGPTTGIAILMGVAISTNKANTTNEGRKTDYPAQNGKSHG